MRNIGFSLQAQYDRPITEVIPLLKAAGFAAVSPILSPEMDFSSLAHCVRDHGMTIQSLHAPHKGIALLWEPNSSSQSLDNILRCIDTCAAFQIPVLVLHGWQGLVYTFPKAPLNFQQFDTIVQYAQHKGVSIAFENLEGEEYLDALMTRYHSLSNVGFCWDSGHDHCYPHRTDFLKAFGHRLIMTHLNDNLGLRDPSGVPSGNDDLHFLPYDGNLDWDHALNRLKDAPEQKILNFEIKIRSHSTASCDLPYLHLSLEQFIEKAGARCHEIARKYDAIVRTQQTAP